MSDGARRSTRGAGVGARPGGGADSWRGLGRRAVRIARQRGLGGKALLVGLGALGGALLAVRRVAPARAGPAAALARSVVRIAFTERRLYRVGPVRGVDQWRLITAEARGSF